MNIIATLINIGLFFEVYVPCSRIKLFKILHVGTNFHTILIPLANILDQMIAT